MKVVLEDVDSKEIEVTIKGNLADARVQHLVSLLKSSNITTKIILFDNGKEVLVNIGDILFCEVVERRTVVVTEGGKYLCKYPLAELLTLFERQGLTQIGKSLLVNVHHVKSLEAEFSGNYVVTLNNGTKLVVSRFYMKGFRQTIMEVSL